MISKKRAGFNQANAIAARIILENPERWGGEESLAVRWARRFTATQRGAGHISVPDSGKPRFAENFRAAKMDTPPLDASA